MGVGDVCVLDTGPRPAVQSGVEDIAAVCGHEEIKTLVTFFGYLEVLGDSEDVGKRLIMWMTG